MRRPTISDIARRAGVSKGSVSYALNGLPGVSAETRRRIVAIAEEIGWQPNSAAKALSGAPARAVGLAIRRPTRILGAEPFFMELVSGMESEFSAASYALMLQIVADEAAELAVYRRWWGEGRIDGAIVTDLRVDDLRIQLLRELGVPCVVVGGPDGVEGVPYVWSDDAFAITEIVQYLAALGHRRVARVAGPRELRHTRSRDTAFGAVCAELGLPTAAIVPTDYTGDEGGRATRRLLSMPTRPTAIVYDNDIMALAGLSVAQEMGMSVPTDLSIVAWDDSPLCGVVRPPLTTMSRDITGFGIRAARLMLQVIAEGDDLEVWSVKDASLRLTPRGSTAPPRAAVG